MVPTGLTPEQSPYVEASNRTIGHSYKKVIYRQYDSTFTFPKGHAGGIHLLRSFPSIFDDEWEDILKQMQ